MKKGGTAAGYIWAFVTVILWSGNFVVSRGVAGLIPPWQCNFWRWVIALAVTLPFAWRDCAREWPLLRARLRYLSLMALLGVTLMNTLIYKAGQTTTSLNMALLVPTAPILILLLSRVLYGEPITRWRVGGMALVIVGVLVLVSRGEWRNLAGLALAAGDLWALGGAVCFALYSLFMRKRDAAVSPLSFNVATFALGLLFAAPFTAAEYVMLPAPVLNWRVVSGVAYTGVCCSALAFWSWTLAVDRIGAVRASTIYYTLPVFAAIASFLILGERIAPAQVTGGLLIIGGVALATFAGRPGVPGEKKAEDRES